MVAINKFEHKGAEDALRNVRNQYRRNRNLFDVADEELPVFGTIASQFNDPGTNVLYLALLNAINSKKGTAWHSSLQIAERESLKKYIIPTDRVHYLGEIVHTVRGYRKQVREQAGIARRLFQLSGAKEVLCKDGAIEELDKQIALFEGKLQEEPKKILKEWPERKASYRRDQLVTKVRGKEIRSDLYTTTLSGTRIPKVCIPDFADWGEILRWSMFENAAGLFPLHRRGIPLQAGRRGSQTPVCGGGDSRADEPAIPLSLQRR